MVTIMSASWRQSSLHIKSTSTPCQRHCYAIMFRCVFRCYIEIESSACRTHYRSKCGLEIGSYQHQERVFFQLVVCQDTGAITDGNGVKDDEMHAIQARTRELGSYNIVYFLWFLFQKCRSEGFCVWCPGLRSLKLIQIETVYQADARGIIFRKVRERDGFFNERVQGLNKSEFRKPSGYQIRRNKCETGAESYL